MRWDCHLLCLARHKREFKSFVQKKFLAFQNLEFMVKFEWSGKREQGRSDRRYCFKKEEGIHDSHCRQGINKWPNTDNYSASGFIEVGKI